MPFEVGYAREEDWENNWKQYFKPFPIGRKLLIKPPWEEAENPENRLVLEIDPASAFGTGQHDTTRLCLELIEEYLQKGDRFLDIGCGSGILSAAAALLGAKETAAADISENALRIAEETYKRNNITRYKLFFGDITADSALRREIGSGFDIIAVNIVSDIIIQMTGFFAEFIKPGAKLLLSGIILPDMNKVADALGINGFKIVKTAESNGWGAIVTVL